MVPDFGNLQQQSVDSDQTTTTMTDGLGLGLSLTIHAKLVKNFKSFVKGVGHINMNVRVISSTWLVGLNMNFY